jgi:hypothetical protein
MKFYKLKDGIIVNLSQVDYVVVEGGGSLSLFFSRVGDAVSVKDPEDVKVLMGIFNENDARRS